MTVVFRIRTSAGQELSFASREMFEDFVRSGDLSPEDFVYDGETGSWSPARTHPVVLDIQYELEAAAEASAAAADRGTSTDGGGDEAGSSAPESDHPGSSAPEPESEERPIGGPGLEFDLALTDELTPEDEQRAFLEQLEAERQGDMDAGPTIRDTLAGLDSDTLAPRQETPPPRAPDPPPSPRPSRSPPPASSRPARSGASPSTRASAGAPSVAAPPKAAPSDRGGGRRALVLVLLAAVLAGGGYVGYQVLSADSEAASPDASVPESPLPEVDGLEADEAQSRVPAPTLPAADPVLPEVGPPQSDTDANGADVGPVREAVIPDTPGAVLERARERYLASTQAALRDLQPVPDVWPTGPYLTAPSDHPAVVDVWQDYRSTIRAVRQTDADRFQSAYQAALDDAAVTGDARRQRLEVAMADFAASQELRDAHFDRVEALATAAIQSHNALIEAEGLLIHDATGSTGRGSGIGQGTSGRNAEAQLLLDQVVALLEGALDADGEGPGAGENVREWVWDGFLDAVTR